MDVKTVMITGASRGIGEATARLFHERGWNVAATMRTPDDKRSGTGGNWLRAYQLELTDPASVDAAVGAIVNDFGRIDAVVNNAAYCLLAPFEGQSDSDLKQQLDTNILGVMRVTKAVLPQMRRQGGGRIINVSSICGRMTLPLYSGYCATKWAIEGFSESLSFELRQHNIKVKIIEPAVFKTGSFDQQLSGLEMGRTHPAYADFVRKVLPRLAARERAAPEPDDVARAIWTAATDRLPRLRYTPRSRAILAARSFVPGALYVRAVRRLLNAW